MWYFWKIRQRSYRFFVAFFVIQENKRTLPKKILKKSKKQLTYRRLSLIIISVVRESRQRNAEVAELADAHGSGPCGSNTLWVRLPSSAGKRPVGSWLTGFLMQKNRIHGTYEYPGCAGINGWK